MQGVISDMNIFSRILLFVYAICLTIISFIAMIVAASPKFFNTISDYVKYNILTNRLGDFIMFIVALIFWGTSLIFLFSGFRNNKDKKAMSKFTNIGEIKISLDTLESIALAASRKLNGVKDTKAHVTKYEDGVIIVIRAVVLPDINIPALSEDIQLKVKKSIEESSGVRVNHVKVLVENIYTGYRSRVE